MAYESTLNWKVIITSRGEGVIRYLHLLDGREWEVTGKCNQCGLCQIGDDLNTNIVWVGPAGTPNAEYDKTYETRKDNPILPGFLENMETMAKATQTATVSGCSLRLRVL